MNEYVWQTFVWRVSKVWGSKDPLQPPQDPTTHTLPLPTCRRTTTRGSSLDSHPIMHLFTALSWPALLPPCSIPPHEHTLTSLFSLKKASLFFLFFFPSRVIKHRAPSVDFLTFDLCVCITILHQQKFRNLLLVTNERLTLDAECEVCTSPT